ncbi:MAG: DNA/RNA nuclease SfsA [Clostridia bacterium]|nr:DNA/RNA nuclease SfsA [Clostridia bacterium]
MKYAHVIPAVFLSRPNRFIANVEIDGEAAVAHVKNTGRCRELLVPGCTVYLSVSDNPARKTKYDLIAVKKPCADGRTRLIHMDSQAPNKMATEWILHSGLFSSDAKVRREVKYGNSRFDLYVEDGCRKCFVEVKGVTLELDGVAMFPDAPTERGIKHLKELIAAKQAGYEAYVLFVIQMKDICLFRPNAATHAAFATALRDAAEAGVHVLAYDSAVTPDSAILDAPVPVKL